MKPILLAAFLLPSMIINAQNMDNVLTPRRQGLAVMAALEAKGDQTRLCPNYTYSIILFHN